MSKPVKYTPVPVKGPARPGAGQAAAKPAEKRPPATAIEKAYLEILEETLTPPEVRNRLVATQTLDQKWKFLQIHKHTDKGVSWGDKEDTLLRTIDSSTSPDIMSVLTLKVLLSSANREFMESFLHTSGTSTLIRVILRTVTRKPYTTVDVAFLYEVLLCCKLIMNNAIGMKGFLEVPGSLDAMAMCLSFDFKPLAMLVLEILSATCYSEQSTALVLHGVQVLGKKNREAPFLSINNALLAADIEVKGAIMQFVISIILGANMDTHELLRKDLSGVIFDHTVDAALAQVDGELGALEDTNAHLAPALLNYHRALSKTPTQGKKVLNTDKLDSGLVALKGLRNSVVRGQHKGQGEAADKTMPADSINRAKAREGLADFHHRGTMQVCAPISGCMGVSYVLEGQLFALDQEVLIAYKGTSDEVDKRLLVADIKDIRRAVRDSNLIRLATKGKLSVLEVITSNEVVSMAGTSEEVEGWWTALQACRDSLVITKSSYYMHSTHLDLSTALTVAESFKRLVEQYKHLSREEETYSSQRFGFDLNNLPVAFSFLSQEVTASGMYLKLLAVVQELLLVPSANDGQWDAIIAGLKNLRRIASRGSGNDASAFSDPSLVDMLSRKAEDEMNYPQVARLATSHMVLTSKVGQLEEELSELQEKEAELSRLLASAGSSEKQALVTKEEEVVRLRALVEAADVSRQLDANALQTLTAKVHALEDRLAEGAKEKETLMRDLEAAKRNVMVVYRDNPNVGTIAPNGVPPAGAPDKYEKYTKMKRMLPEAAVRQKMAMDGFPEAEINAFMDGTLTAAPAPAAESAPAAPEVSERYAKYEKMKKMLPEGAVRQKMMTDGFTPAEIEAFFSGTPLLAAAPAPVPEVSERYAKYEKMKKMLPEGAVRQKMMTDGFTPAEIEAFFSGTPLPAAGAAPAAAPALPEKFEKYVKMKKMLPEAAVRQKMAMDGFPEAEINAFMDGTLMNAAPPAAAPMDPAKAEQMAKYEKMKKMLPEGAVRQKMMQEGLSPQEIDAFFGIVTAAAPLTTTTAAAPALPKLTPPQAIKFSKYEKLFKKGTSLDDIKARMADDEVSPEDQAIFVTLLTAPKAPTPGPVVPAAKPAAPVETRVKLKNIFWNKLAPTEVKSTMWAKCREYPLSPPQRTLIETWFVAAKAAERRASTGGIPDSDSQKVVDAKPKLISVLDGKRTQNILIIMGKIRRTPEEVMALIWEVDPAQLTIDLTQMLISILPNAEETTALTPFNVDSSATLEPASRLMWCLLRIPRLEARLSSHEVVFTFMTNLQAINTSCKIYLSALDELSRCTAALNSLLSVVLSVGNYLNYGTKFGSATGIKLDTLNKLITIKATQGTLLHMLALLVADTPLITISDDWVAIWAAADLNYKQIQIDLNQLEGLFTKLQAELVVVKENKMLGIDKKPLSDHKANPLYKRLDTFLTSSKVKLVDLKNNMTKVEQGMDTLMSAYGENAKEVSDEDTIKRFWNLIVSFVRNLRKAHEDNTRRRIAAEKAAKAADLKAAKARAASLPPVPISPKGKSVKIDESSAPVDNIFGRFHSLQQENTEEVLAQYRLKLSGRQQSVQVSAAMADLAAEEEAKA